MAADIDGTPEWLTVEESHDLFNQRSNELVGMSREEFLTALNDGDLEGLEEAPGYRALFAILTFALVG